MDERDILAEKIYISLIGNPARYEEIKEWIEVRKKKGVMGLHEMATQKNINKAYKLADALIEHRKKQ